MERKTTVWILHATNRRNCTHDEIGMAKKSNSQEGNLAQSAEAAEYSDCFSAEGKDFPKRLSCI